jgi:Kdo2-lipid IVA lauroyltransferase/acyltransferase
MARASDIIEAAGAYVALALLGALPVDAASAIGGFLGRTIGPHLGISRRAERNLRRALPELGAADRRRIIRRMWDNLGRVLAEYPHLAEFAVYKPGGRVEIRHAEHILDQGATGRGAIFLSGHFGNWEVLPMAATGGGLKVVEIIRAANNPIVERMVTRLRKPVGTELAPKGQAAARLLVAALRAGKHIAVLADMKMNDGIAVPFFGHAAMTGPAVARLALRFDVPLVPVRIERTTGAHFRITAEPPLEVVATGDLHADTLAIMRQINDVLERWIRDRPEQWFWLQRRWPEEAAAAVPPPASDRAAPRTS